ncbi:MAG: alpha/beta fold hydrolase [Pseudomonadota bacterium]
MVKLAQMDFGGDGDRPALILLHGLLGTARNLTTVARSFSKTRRVIGLDMRNHGQSPRLETQSYLDMAEDVAETLVDFGEEYDLLGHSMGGKAAMVGVLERWLTPRKVVVGDIAPVAYDHSQAPYISAMLSTDLSQYARRAPLAADLGKAVGDDVMGQFMAQSARLGPDAGWIPNLDVLLREMDVIVGFPSYDDPVDQDVFFVAGGASPYVDADAVHRLFPAARIEVIRGAGHWVHAEAPEAFNDCVRAYLDGSS